MKVSDIEVNLIHHVGDDLTTVNAARVSFDKESEWCVVGVDDPSPHQEFVLSEKDVKLINYLAKHGHHSPFNHSFLTFRVKAPLFVARQLVKHKFLPWNEVSRRYVDDEPEFYFPEYWRKKADNVKQGSSEEKWDPLNYVAYECASTVSLCMEAVRTYKCMIETGCCPEQARMLLPQNMMTTWYWSGTLGAFLDMLKLRLDPHTQKESRDVAKKIYEDVKNLFPVSTEAYLNES